MIKISRLINPFNARFNTRLVQKCEFSILATDLYLKQQLSVDNNLLIKIIKCEKSFQQESVYLKHLLDYRVSKKPDDKKVVVFNEAFECNNTSLRDVLLKIRHASKTFDENEPKYNRVCYLFDRGYVSNSGYHKDRNDGKLQVVYSNGEGDTRFRIIISEEVSNGVMMNRYQLDLDNVKREVGEIAVFIGSKDCPFPVNNIDDLLPVTTRIKDLITGEVIDEKSKIEAKILNARLNSPMIDLLHSSNGHGTGLSVVYT